MPQPVGIETDLGTAIGKLRQNLQRHATQDAPTENSLLS
jgi:hypothetical protein